MNLETALNNAFHANEFNGFIGYEAEPVVIMAEEFEMDLSWVDDESLESGFYSEDDAYADGQALASAGWGTDEDYGCYEGE